MAKTLLVLGGRSDIGQAIAHEFAANGFDIVLAARRSDSLEVSCRDIEVRHGVKARFTEFDAGAVETHAGFYAGIDPKPDVVLYAIGVLGDQPTAQNEWAEAESIIVSNYTGAVSILSIIANEMGARKGGSIIGISSVAGDRGRQSNYVYGSAKAGFTAFMAGLRHRLTADGVHVMTVKPGFVATKMTEGMDLPKPLTADPKKMARAVFKAYTSKRSILYYLPIWRQIMLAVRNVPESIFVKSKL